MKNRSGLRLTETVRIRLVLLLALSAFIVVGCSTRQARILSENKSVVLKIVELAIYRLAHGKIVEQWGVPDLHGLLEQLNNSNTNRQQPQ